MTSKDLNRLFLRLCFNIMFRADNQELFSSVKRVYAIIWGFLFVEARNSKQYKLYFKHTKLKGLRFKDSPFLFQF